MHRAWTAVRRCALTYKVRRTQQQRREGCGADASAAHIAERTRSAARSSAAFLCPQFAALWPPSPALHLPPPLVSARSFSMRHHAAGTNHAGMAAAVNNSPFTIREGKAVVQRPPKKDAAPKAAAASATAAESMEDEPAPAASSSGDDAAVSAGGGSGVFGPDGIEIVEGEGQQEVFYNKASPHTHQYYNVGCVTVSDACGPRPTPGELWGIMATTTRSAIMCISARTAPRASHQLHRTLMVVSVVSLSAPGASVQSRLEHRDDSNIHR